MGEGRFPATRFWVWPGRNPCGGGGICEHEFHHMPKQIERCVEKVQEDILACPNEQIYDGTAVSWSYLEDILIDRHVPKRLWDDVVSQLRCPKCDSTFQIWYKVGIKPQCEIMHEHRIEKALKHHNGKLIEFTNFLKSTPYLGVLHPIGKRIVKEIGGLVGNSITNQSWFRARRLDSPVPMTIDDLRPPDPRKKEIPEGRFNHFGQGCWYLADDPTAAAAEVMSSMERLTWVQEWKIENVSNVLDLRAWQADDNRAYDHEGEPIDFPLLPIALIFGDYLNAKPPKESRWHPEYLVPRFVADAARHAGFSGIWFRSTRSFGENLVLFDTRTPLLPVGTPNLVRLDDKDAERRDGLFFYQGFPISIPDFSDLGMS